MLKRKSPEEATLYESSIDVADNQLSEIYQPDADVLAIFDPLMFAHQDYSNEDTRVDTALSQSIPQEDFPQTSYFDYSKGSPAENLEENCNSTNNANINTQTNNETTHYPKFVSVGGCYYKDFQLAFPVYFYADPMLDKRQMSNYRKDLNNACSSLAMENLTPKFFNINEDHTIITFSVHHLFLLRTIQKNNKNFIEDNCARTTSIISPEDALMSSANVLDGLKQTLFVGKGKQYIFELESCRTLYKLVNRGTLIDNTELRKKFIKAVNFSSVELDSTEIKLEPYGISFSVDYFSKLMQLYGKKSFFIKLFHLDSTLDWYSNNELFFCSFRLDIPQVPVVNHLLDQVQQHGIDSLKALIGQGNQTSNVSEPSNVQEEDLYQYSEYIAIGFREKDQLVFQLAHPVYFFVNPLFNYRTMEIRYANLSNHCLDIDMEKIYGKNIFHINEDKTIITLPIQNYKLIYQIKNYINKRWVQPLSVPRVPLLSETDPLRSSVCVDDGLKQTLKIGKLSQYIFELSEDRTFYKLTNQTNKLNTKLRSEFCATLMPVVKEDFTEIKEVDDGIIFSVEYYYRLMEIYGRCDNFVRLFHLDSTLDWYTSNHLFFKRAAANNNNNQTTNIDVHQLLYSS